MVYTKIGVKIIYGALKKFKHEIGIVMPRNISVLMVSTFPPDKDGIASYTFRLENALRKENISVKIAANGRDWKRNSLTYIFSIIRKSLKSTTNIVHFQLSYFLFGNEYYTSFFPLLSLSLKLLDKKVVITLHDVVQKSTLKDSFLKNHTRPGFLSFKRLALEYYTRISCLIADKVIVHSQIAQNVLAQDYHVPQKKIQIIPHGIDQVIIAASGDQFRKKFPTNKNHQVVSYFGLVRKGKGLEDLVRAWKKLKNVNAILLIIGGKHPINHNDNFYENLISLVKELGLESSIRFCGYVPDEFLPAYLSESDVFVLPYNEWGDVIASSGALSIVAPYLKPIIATDVPAFLHMKKLGAALIVKRGDPDGLASAIMEVLTDVQKRNLLVTELFKWLPESSWLVVARKTAALYRAIL
jgi:glycosyltransferase involved in cell wall biosynthesis